MSAAPAGPALPARSVGTLGIALLALNGMIGAGIFGVPAGAAALAGPWSPLVFVACGLLLAAVMLCFAEIASRFDRTGGPILYVQTAFGDFAGFQTGWAFYIARATAFAANLNLLLASLAWLWPPADDGAVRIALLALLMGALAWVNVLGIDRAVRALGVLTALKLVPLVALVVAGLAWLAPAGAELARTPPPPLRDFGLAALLVVYAFVGWESAVVPAGETRNPQRSIPVALFAALACATLLYVAVQAVAVAVLPGLADSERALVDVGRALMGVPGALLLTAGVVVSVAGNVAGTMISAPRLTYAMARERWLPGGFDRLHPVHGTPHVSIVVFAVLTFALAAVGSFLWLAAMSAMVRVLIYMGCIAAMPRLRRETGPAGLRLPGGWTIPLIAFSASLLLLIQVDRDAVA
ncbi:MAG: APC family permease, partial [Wenzhouxiangellaceae bacterium]|nr:APC family permease [Wenzhouxiangellaceae bacterium]